MNARCLALASALALGACAHVPEEDAPQSTPKAQTAPAPVAAPRPAPLPEQVAVAPPVARAPEQSVVVQPVMPQVPRPGDMELVLGEFERWRRLPPAELARETEAARAAFSQSRADSARLRWAMLLTLPGNPGLDDVRALELLEPLVKNAAAPLHGLAFLVAAYIQEQRRLTTQVQGLERSTQGLQQNVQALQQKLDALRSLERSLSEREVRTRRR